MLQFKAISGSTLYNVCMNTYGSYDYIVKLMKDNKISNINQYPIAGQIFLYDETLVFNKLALGNVKYSTANKKPNGVIVTKGDYNISFSNDFSN